jgi:hypothetical protein
MADIKAAIEAVRKLMPQDEQAIDRVTTYFRTLEGTIALLPDTMAEAVLQAMVYAHTCGYNDGWDSRINADSLRMQQSIERRLAVGA